MKILVYGLGAIGTVFATFLKEKGHIVYGITKEKYLKQIQDNRISVSGIWGFHEANLNGIYSTINNLKDTKFDLIIVSVKSYDTQEAIRDIINIFSENSFVLLTQNGYGNYEIAKTYLPAQSVLLARVIFGAKVIQPGKVEVTVNADDVIIGQPENLADEKKVKNIVDVVNKSGIPARYDPNVYQILWDKIIYNCALNPLGAILEKNYGFLAENSETREIMNNIIDEIFLVAQKNNIKLRWKNSKEYKKFFYETLIPPTKDHFPSMYYDIKSGKKTEIEALNGAIIKLAKKANISVPINQTITNLILAKEKQNL